MRSVAAGVSVPLFARGNGDIEPVLLRRQRACGKTGECTRRILCLIKIENGRTTLRHVSVKKTPCTVGCVMAGLVPKDDEQTVLITLLYHRFQADVAPIQLKSQQPR